MFFSLAVALMVVLVAAFWAYQGFFSALIMFFESLIAMMLAFGFYESVNGLWVEQTGPGLGLPLAFMVLLLGTLALMRVATDKLMPDQVSLPLPVDRAGAAIAGFFTGMILIGSTLTAIQMLPIGSGVFGFERYTSDKNGKPERHNLGIFRPDEFACGLAAMLSNDRFGGELRLGEQKPDLIRSLYSSRAVPMSEEPIFLKPDMVKVNAIWQVAQLDHVTQDLAKDTMTRSFQSDSPNNANNTFIVCNVSIAKNASGEVGKGEIRFRMPQFRIVGPPPKSDGIRRQPVVVFACGMTDIYTHRKHGPATVSSEQRKRLCAFAPTTDFVLGDRQTKIVEEGDQWRFDVAFEVPQDFQPWYLEFKRGGRVDLAKIKLMKEPPNWASRAQGQGGKQGVVQTQTPKVGTAPGGALHVANAIEERTDATDLIPIPLDKNDPAVARFLVQGKLGGDNCQFWCEPKQYVLSEEERVEKFLVPDGKRMVQIGADVLKQSNMYSRAIGFANRVLAQIKITDDKGNDYFAIGFYAATEINGTWTIEVQYDPNSEVPERALKQPTKVKHGLMTKAGPDNTKFGFLFAVEPGVKIVSFSPGAGKSQPVNIDVPG